MREEKILINGLETNYKIAGSGPAILVLHGWGGSSDSWIDVQKLLAKKGYLVVCLDFPGFGKTFTPPTAWGIKDYTQWLNNFLEEIQKKHSEFKKPFFLLGHSFGGRISIRFAVQSPEAVRKLILCASAGIKQKPGLKTTIIYWLAKIGNIIFSPKHLVRLKDAVRNFFYIILRHKDYVKAEGTMKETIKKVLEEDLVLDLESIKIKTLLIWGEKDKMVPLKYGHIFKEKIPNSELIILPKIGHSPHLEVPNKLSEIIISFFKS